MANGPELLLKPTHGLIEERRGFLRESAALPVQLRAQPAKRASSARKLLPVPMNGVHKSKQPLLRRTQAVPLRLGCAKLLEAPLHHGFGEFFLGFEVVVDIAYRHASRLGDVRQTRLSETASIRELRRSLNQPRSLVRLCRSHILRLTGVSYLTNSDHKPDAPVLSTKMFRSNYIDFSTTTTQNYTYSTIKAPDKGDVGGSSPPRPTIQLWRRRWRWGLNLVRINVCKIGASETDIDAALAYAAELTREGTVDLPLEIKA